MSRFPELVCALAASLMIAGPAVAGETLGLGRAATPAEIAAWDIDIRPDGAGLPQGQGDVETGEALFSEACAACHGDFGEGVDRWPVLAGGEGTLASDDPVKTVGSYWPDLSTVWDYVHRAMPFGDAQSLTDDEVYAIVAYILYSNDIVDDDFVLTRDNFLSVAMPNADGFFDDDRLTSPVWAAREPCMRDCKDEVRITARARVLDVTPEEEGEEAAASAETEVAAVAPAPAAPEPAAPAAIDEALAAKGEKVFRKCKACHQVGADAKNRTGPILTGIVGAPVGAVDGFKYSKVFAGLAEDGVAWDAEALDGFLEKPRAWAKGTKMAFGGLKKPEDRAAIIEYLRAASR